jgi:methionine sulfoxide reductase heme-binding subunit
MTSLAKHRPPTVSVILIAGLSTTLIGLINASLFGGWSLDGASAATRITARCSFVWFIAVWGIGPLASMWPGGWRLALLLRRRALGLGFAAAHFVHLIALTTFIGYFGHESSIVAIVGGGLCYVVLFAMALTSHNWWIARLGPKRWKILHVVGGYFAAAIFTNSYVGRLESQPILAITALIVLAVAFGLHAMTFWKKRQSAVQMTTGN